MGARLYNWFFAPCGCKGFGDCEREVMATVARSFVWVMVVLFIFLKIGLIRSIGSSVNFSVWFLNQKDVSLSQAFGSAFAVFQFLGTLVFAPFLEELVFRVLPCVLATDDSGKLRPRIGVPIVLFGSFFAFGYVHGQGYLSIIIQGVLGLFLLRLFLRNGPRIWVAYLSCVAAHSMYNLLTALCHFNYASN